MSTKPILFITTCFLAMCILAIACTKDDSSSSNPNTNCSYISYTGSNTSCPSDYIPVSDTKCCPTAYPYWCSSNGTCYADCSTAPCTPIKANTGGNNGGGGSGKCSSSYVSPSSDGQLDAYCHAAYVYRCVDGASLSDASVQQVCQAYEAVRPSGVPECSYCQ